MSRTRNKKNIWNFDSQDPIADSLSKAATVDEGSSTLVISNRTDAPLNIEQFVQFVDKKIGYQLKRGNSKIAWNECIYIFDGDQWLDATNRRAIDSTLLQIQAVTGVEVQKNTIVVLKRIAEKIISLIKQAYKTYAESDETEDQQAAENLSKISTSGSSDSSDDSSDSSEDSSDELEEIEELDKNVAVEKAPNDVSLPPPSSDAPVDTKQMILRMLGVTTGKVSRAQLDTLLKTYIGTTSEAAAEDESDTEQKSDIRMEAEKLLTEQRAVDHAQQVLAEARQQLEAAKRKRRPAIIGEIRAMIAEEAAAKQPQNRNM